MRRRGDTERRLLQITVSVGCLVPLGGGLAGVIFGPAMLGDAVTGGAVLDSHFRYLSGLLLAIGLGYVSTVSRIETHRQRFALLTGLVLVGGIGRLVSALSYGTWPPAMWGALLMELAVTPALALWQWHVSTVASGRMGR